MSKLTVKREPGCADKMRKFSILVDGVSIGSIAEGETLHSEINPQKHRIEARVDLCGSRTLEIDGTHDQCLTVRSGLPSWHGAHSLYKVFIDRKGYLELEVNNEN
ncbi:MULTISPECIES: hypothetical protein [Gimesia]|uniref:Uncharacterized protein n=2 Tax=Gimesia TaxID=1649453 RepID=A0A6I6AGZ7_9PLAN|nr:MULTISPECIES: hypothetical protein [Gimesia]MCR9231850.1 hypothetical protein [bacterium]KAA0140599.1 hypothetical protein FYZ48_04785 [Gimesia chilikensis]QDT23887.1 hypothetical protein HG66A1_57120 [Gimesia chilikensis]QDT87689.1 hypothetical protein MalM14_53770 [Gimesia chilikensis]QGQ24381.1 hypothetical protein F1728_17530 [Gimesia benthica]